MKEDGHVIEPFHVHDQSSSIFTITLIKLSGPIAFYIQGAKFNRCCDDLDHHRGVHLFGRNALNFPCNCQLELSFMRPVMFLNEFESFVTRIAETTNNLHRYQPSFRLNMYIDVNS